MILNSSTDDVSVRGGAECVKGRGGLPTGGLGERRKLRKRVLVHFELEQRIWRLGVRFFLCYFEPRKCTVKLGHSGVTAVQWYCHVVI